MIINLSFENSVNRPDETLAAVEDTVVGEVCYVLREWSIFWKKLYTVSSFVLNFVDIPWAV